MVSRPRAAIDARPSYPTPSDAFMQANTRKLYVRQYGSREPKKPLFYDLKPSLMLWLLALIGGFEIGKMPVFAFEPCFTFAKA